MLKKFKSVSLKKLNSNSGAAYVLALIFWLLMMTALATPLSLSTSNSETTYNYYKNEYYYAVAKSGLNYFSDFFSGLQWTETGELALPTDPSLFSTTGNYSSGEFSFVDSSKLATFERYVNKDDFQTQFSYFRTLNDRVSNGSNPDYVFINTIPEENRPPFEYFQTTFTMENVENIYGYNGDTFTINATLTFYGDEVYQNNFNSTNPNTAQLVVTISSDTVISSYKDTNYTVAYDKVLYTLTSLCVPIYEETATDSGLYVWTWEKFA